MGAAPSERPKYGVLNIGKDPQGMRAFCAQTYGKSYLQLHGVRLRTTFSATDSGNMVADYGKEPTPQLPKAWELPDHRVATLDYCAHILLEFSAKELRAALDVGSGKEDAVNSKIFKQF